MCFVQFSFSFANPDFKYSSPSCLQTTCSNSASTLRGRGSRPAGGALTSTFLATALPRVRNSEDVAADSASEAKSGRGSGGCTSGCSEESEVRKRRK